MVKVIVLCLVLSLALGTQYVPVVKRNVGIPSGNPSGDIKIDLIYDPLCDDSADFDQNFQKVWTALGSDLQNRISLRFISLSLPYHLASQKLTQAIIYVQQAKGNTQALALFRDFLSNIDKYDEKNIQNESIGGLMIRIAQRVNSLFGLNTEDVLKELAHGSASDGKTRQWSKVVMGSIKVAGTPRMRINEVIVDGATDMTVQQLVDLIKSLLATTEELTIQ